MVWLAVAPFAAVLVAAAAALVLDAFQRRTLALGVAAAGLGVGAAVAFAGAWTGPSSIVVGPFAAGGALSAVPGVVFLSGALALVGGWQWFRASGGPPQAALIALAAVSSGLAAASTDLTTTFLAVEGAALAGYALVASGRTRMADEASVKYFIQGAIAASLLVFGLGPILAFAGSTGLGDVNRVASAASLPMVGGVVLFLVGLAFKTGAFPFSAWVPDVYEASPPASAAFLAAGPKAGALTAFALLAVSFQGEVMQGGAVQGFIIVVAATSIVFGNLVALRQRSYQRMLAYSGIAQAGYALVGVSVGATSAAALMIATYALGATVAFLVAEAVRRSRPAWDGSIRGLAGLRIDAPLVAVGLAVAMLSLTGIPPLFGFWGKLQVFAAAISVGQGWLALLGLLGSVVSFGYYGAALRAAFFDDAPDSEHAPSGRFDAARLAVVVASAGLLLLGLAPLLFGVAWLGRLFAL